MSRDIAHRIAAVGFDELLLRSRFRGNHEAARKLIYVKPDFVSGPRNDTFDGVLSAYELCWVSTEAGHVFDGAHKRRIGLRSVVSQFLRPCAV